MRNVTLNFPLSQGVVEVLVGLDEKAEILPPPPYKNDKLVVVYGTSITQGGCACRPGMAYTNILSRRLNVEFINLGFSGSGRGEPEVAQTIAEIPNPACFVLDYEANCVSAELLQKTFPEFIRILRSAHPNVSILAISRIPTASESFNQAARKTRLERRDFQKRTVDELRAKGDRMISFKDGSDLLGEGFDECTVDGSHPTDLGFLRMADGLTPVLKKILA
jgi:lysophospholipase L1-like esterase